MLKLYLLCSLVVRRRARCTLTPLWKMCVVGVLSCLQVSLNPAYQVKEVEFTLKQVGACSIRHSLIHTTTSAILRTWGMRCTMNKLRYHLK